MGAAFSTCFFRQFLRKNKDQVRSPLAFRKSIWNGLYLEKRKLNALKSIVGEAKGMQWLGTTSPPFAQEHARPVLFSSIILTE